MKYRNKLIKNYIITGVVIIEYDTNYNIIIRNINDIINNTTLQYKLDNEMRCYYEKNK